MEVAQVVGVDRPGIGQVAVAFVRLTGPVSEDDLRTHCAAGIAGFKVPARFVVVDAFPTSAGPNGVKIRKSELRDRAAARTRRRRAMTDPDSAWAVRASQCSTAAFARARPFFAAGATERCSCSTAVHNASILSSSRRTSLSRFLDFPSDASAASCSAFTAR